MYIKTWARGMKEGEGGVGWDDFANQIYLMRVTSGGEVRVSLLLILLIYGNSKAEGRRNLFNLVTLSH